MASNELTSVREVIISAEGVREVIISADERLSSKLAKSFEIHTWFLNMSYVICYEGLKKK
jgi:hypothetical protein